MGPDSLAFNNYEIHLLKVENGFIVRVGCKIFVSETWEQVKTELDNYYKGLNSKYTEKYKKELRGLGDARMSESQPTLAERY